MAGAPALALMHSSPPPSSSPAHTNVLHGELTVAAAGPVRTVEDPGTGFETSPPTEPTTTVAAPTSTTAVTALRPSTRAAPTTTVPRHTTTTVKAAPAKPAAAPAKPAPKPSSAPSGSAAPAPSGRTQSGGATWYDAAPPGTCAHKTLPMGTVVTIRASNGATAQCRVSDRGPYADGMIIDLAKDVFTQLAPLSQGVVQVTISW